MRQPADRTFTFTLQLALAHRQNLNGAVQRKRLCWDELDWPVDVDDCPVILSRSAIGATVDP